MCQMTSSVQCSEDGLNKLATGYSHDVLTNCKFMQSVSSKYGVKAMPTFFLIKNKEVVRKIVGANPDEVKKLVDASAEPFDTPQIVVG